MTTSTSSSGNSSYSSQESREKRLGNITILQLCHEHIEQARSLSATAGWPHRREDWLFMLDLGTGFAACDGGELVGTAMTWSFGQALSTLGMVLVAPGMKGRGIGRKLVSTALAEIKTPTIALNATKEGIPLYRSLGFRSTESVFQCQGEATAMSQTLSFETRNVRPSAVNDLSAIKSLDWAATGVEREAIIESLYAIGDCAVLTENEVTIGFSIRRPFGRGYVIGPIVAPDDNAARALIAHWATQSGKSFLRLDVPKHEHLVNWLGENGLVQVGTVGQMVRGPQLAKSDPDSLYALTSQAMG